MKLLFQLLLGVIISVIIFLLLATNFSEDLGPFFSLSVPIGLVLGMQIVIYNKIKEKS